MDQDHAPVLLAKSLFPLLWVVAAVVLVIVLVLVSAFPFTLAAAAVALAAEMPDMGPEQAKQEQQLGQIQQREQGQQSEQVRQPKPPERVEPERTEAEPQPRPERQSQPQSEQQSQPRPGQQSELQPEPQPEQQPRPGWRYITRAEYLDKVKGGFAGQLVGNIFGLPYEGQFTYTPGPAEITYYKEVPTRAFSDDDTFVELVALKNLEDNGIDATPAQLAAKWVEHIPRGGVACANFVALENFHRGIMPPASGQPENNIYYLYIDAQIESEIYGLIAPGMPATAQEYAERFARLTNASDGVLGAIYMATLYSLAFFENDPEQLVAQAMAALPPESRYARVIRAAYDGFKAKPEFKDWRTVRNAVVRQYYRAGWSPNTGWVQADVNGAMVTLALLYGGGDFERTVQVAVQAGLDNDCNAATAAGVVGTMLGYSRLPEKWVAPIGEVYWNRSLMGFPQYLRISDIAERIAAAGEQVVVAWGGRVEQDQRELLVIRAQTVPQAGYEPQVPEAEVVKHMARPWNPAWEVINPGFDMSPGLRTEYAGRSHVFVTHPKNQQVPAELRRTVTVWAVANDAAGAGAASLAGAAGAAGANDAAGAVGAVGAAASKPVRTVLRIGVTNYDRVADCDWVLKVYVNDGVTETLLDQRVIQRVNGQHQWYDLEYDLTPWAGKTVTVRLLNVANNWYYEAGYWSHAEIVELVGEVESAEAVDTRDGVYRTGE